MSEGLKKAGIIVNQASSTRDLGHGNAAGKRRSVKIQKQRMNAANKRVSRIKRLAKINPKANKLLPTGAWPQGTWGHTGMGLAPTHRNAPRGKVAAASGIQAGGKCTTTAIALTLGQDQDPDFKTPKEQIQDWAMLWMQIEPKLSWGSSFNGFKHFEFCKKSLGGIRSKAPWGQL